MTDRIRCTWWEKTAEMTPWRDGISSPIYRNMETGETLPIYKLPAGALWAWQPPYDPKTPDGLKVNCRLPDGRDWHIDGRATNCTMVEDDEHHCWIRHGTVGEPVTVDKNGRTCSAGAGSIATPDYHGFLRAGYLERC